MKKRLRLSCMTLACSSSCLIVGCNDRTDMQTSLVEPVDSIVYYISGYVHNAQGDTLSGVTISTPGYSTTSQGGFYSLPVRATGDYSMTFARADYRKRCVCVSIPHNGEAFSEASASATLSPLATTDVVPSAWQPTYIRTSSLGTSSSVGICPNDNAPEGECSICIEIPAQTTHREIKTSYYILADSPTDARTGSNHLSMGAIGIHADPPDLEDQNIRIALSNPMPGEAFDSLMLVDADGRERIVAYYDSLTNAYPALISHVSGWTFLAPYTQSATEHQETHYIDTDNRYNGYTLRRSRICFPFYAGWEVEACSKPELQSCLTCLIANQKGCQEGTTCLYRTRHVNVDAHSVLRFAYSQHYRTELYEFSFLSGERAMVRVRQYLDLSTLLYKVGHASGSGK